MSRAKWHYAPSAQNPEDAISQEVTTKKLLMNYGGMALDGYHLKKNGLNQIFIHQKATQVYAKKLYLR